jgi:hypothetical protein
VEILREETTLKNTTGKRKKLLLAAAILLFVFGATAVVAGSSIQVLNMGTDPEGYALSNTYSVRTSTNAFVLVVSPLRVSSTWNWLYTSGFAQAKWVVAAIDPAKEVFVGWTRAADGEPYSRHFNFEVGQDWHYSMRSYNVQIDVPSTSIFSSQGAPTRPPAGESLWLKSSTSKGSATLYYDPVWDTNAGFNMLVVMNADGSSGVNTDIQLGYSMTLLGWLPYVLIPIGALLVILGLMLFKRRNRK